VKDKINCLIVDDEPLARRGLEKYVQQVDFLSLVGQCKNALEANQALLNGPVDVIFLDIEMPNMSGISFLKTLPESPWVIFTTAYAQYALEGYQFRVLDYLLKPVAFEHFLRAANKLHRLLLPSAPDAATPAADYIFVKSNKSLVKIRLSELLFIQSMQNFVVLHTGDAKYITLLTLKEAYEMLPTGSFIQTHKSYVVSKDKVEVIRENEIIIGAHCIPISSRLRAKVLEELTHPGLRKRPENGSTTG
jgi:DNA-binding LytR/AlgR family response regulator